MAADAALVAKIGAAALFADWLAAGGGGVDGFCADGGICLGAKSALGEDVSVVCLGGVAAWTDADCLADAAVRALHGGQRHSAGDCVDCAALWAGEKAGGGLSGNAVESAADVFWHAVRRVDWAGRAFGAGGRGGDGKLGAMVQKAQSGVYGLAG